MVQLQEAVHRVPILAVLLILAGCAATVTPLPVSSYVPSSPSAGPAFSAPSSLGIPFPVPSAESSPSPSPTPSPTPAPNINKVKATGGVGQMTLMDKPPWYGFYFNGMTVVYVREDKAANSVLIALTSAGSRIERQLTYPNVYPEGMNFYDFTGFTVWVEITKYSYLGDNTIGILGRGAEAVMPYLEVGRVFRQITTESDETGITVPHYADTPAERAINRASGARLLASVGESFPRTDRRFFFYGSPVVVEGYDLVNP